MRSGNKGQVLLAVRQTYIMLNGSFLEYCTCHNMSNRAKGLVTRTRMCIYIYIYIYIYKDTHTYSIYIYIYIYTIFKCIYRYIVLNKNI